MDVAPTPCPECGGTVLKPIAPGYWECQTTLRGTIGLPVGPKGELVPVDSSGICGNRFQTGVTGSVGATCSCGTFAIGLCRSCSSPICGDHSKLFTGQRLCHACWNTEYAKTPEAIQQSEHEEEKSRADAVIARSADPDELANAIVTRYWDWDTDILALERAWVRYIRSAQLLPTHEIVEISTVGRGRRLQPPREMSDRIRVWRFVIQGSGSGSLFDDQHHPGMVGFLSSDAQMWAGTGDPYIRPVQPRRDLYALPVNEPPQIARQRGSRGAKGPPYFSNAIPVHLGPTDLTKFEWIRMAVSEIAGLPLRRRPQ